MQEPNELIVDESLEEEEEQLDISEFATRHFLDSK